MTDEALMEAFRGGDAQAFDALFRRHAPLVRGYLLRLVMGDHAQADDLVQATFLSVVRARGRFLRGARFKPWLYAIATNAARDARRRRKLEAVTDDGSLPDQEVVAGLAAGAGGLMTLHLHCPNGTLGHLLLFHLVPSALVSLLAVGVRRRLSSASWAP